MSTTETSLDPRSFWAPKTELDAARAECDRLKRDNARLREREALTDREHEQARVLRLRGERDALYAEVDQLKRALAQALNRPLVALAPDARITELETENARLRRRLEAVRELLKKHGALE